MVSIPKILGVLSCGFLLCLGLSHAAQADNAAASADEKKAAQSEMKADQTDWRQGGQEAGERQMNDVQGGQSTGGKTMARTDEVVFSASCVIVVLAWCIVVLTCCSMAPSFSAIATLV